MAGEHEIMLDRAAMRDVLERLLDAKAPRIGETAGRVLLIVRPRGKGALAEAAHALGLVDADLLLFLGRDENQGVVRRLHRIGEPARIPFARVDQIALGHPIILLRADADVELEMMIADRVLRISNLAFAPRLQITQER